MVAGRGIEPRSKGYEPFRTNPALTGTRPVHPQNEKRNPWIALRDKGAPGFSPGFKPVDSHTPSNIPQRNPRFSSPARNSGGSHHVGSHNTSPLQRVGCIQLSNPGIWCSSTGFRWTKSHQKTTRRLGLPLDGTRAYPTQRRDRRQLRHLVQRAKNPSKPPREEKNRATERIPGDKKQSNTNPSWKSSVA